MTAARAVGGAMSERRAPTRVALCERHVELTAIVHEYRSDVHRLAWSVVGDAALADDVTQETFLKVWTHLDGFRGDGSLKSWILRIAHNQSVSSLRVRRDRATAPARLPERADPLSVSRIVEGQAAASDIVRAIGGLDDLSRTIVTLRDIDGLSYRDVAATLDVPVSTVKTRLMRSRQLLAAQLVEWSVS